MTTTPNVTDEQIHELAREIARRLGADWSIDPAKQGVSWAQIACKDGRGLHVAPVRQHSSREARVCISASVWPEYIEDDGVRRDKFYPHQLREPKETAPTMTIALARGIDAICKELARRIMPEYARIWTRCAAEATELQAYHTRESERWQALCKALGGPCDPSRAYLYVEGADVNMRIERSGDTRVTVKDLYVTHAQALEIARVLGAKVVK